jgi:hypothetical protein
MSQNSFLLRRIEKLESQLRKFKSGGGVRKANRIKDNSLTWAICRNTDGLEANRVVRMWTRKIDDGDDEDDVMGGLPSCDYIDYEDCDYMNENNFRYGVTAHKVDEADEKVMIKTSGEVMIAFQTDATDKIKFGDLLYPCSNDGSVAGYGDNIGSREIFRALESESSSNDYEIIKCEFYVLSSLSENKRFRVKVTYGDYIMCHGYDTVNDEEDDEDILIAKPYLLRQTPFDGESIVFSESQTITYTYSDEATRSATDGTDTETQVIVPSYFENDEIIAVSRISGGTGVVVNDVQLAWEDMNTTGRFWAVIE